MGFAGSGIVILFSAQVVSHLLLVLSIVISFCLSASILLAMGIVILFIANRFRTSVLMLVLLMTISSYLYVGVTGNFSGDQIVCCPQFSVKTELLFKV